MVTNQVKAGMKFLQNKNVHLDIEGEEGEIEVCCAIDFNNNRIWTGGNGHWSNTKKEVITRGLYLQIVRRYEGTPLTSKPYWDGGMAGSIAYDGSGKQGTWYDGKSLSIEEKGGLINPIKNQDSDGLIYGDQVFIENCVKYMIEHCDFDNNLLNEHLSFEYSEQGMQENEDVNLDVSMDGDFWMLCAAGC